MPVQTSFLLEPIPPFRLDLTVWTLRRRPDNVVDRWDGKTYRRVLIDDDGPFEIAVTQLDEPGGTQLRIFVTRDLANPDVKACVTAALGHLIGVRVDLTEFYHFSAQDEVLGSLANQFRGVKPPRFSTPFEALVNAIACQQLSLTVGIRLLNHLAETYGPIMETEAGIFHAFPRPQELAEVDLEELRDMGFSYQKARYLTGLAQAIIGKQFNLDEIQMLDDKRAVNHLCSLNGVGRWTAEYFLLRGLGRTHIFPGDDVGARNHLQRWLGLSGPISYDGVHKAMLGWDGYGGLVYFHLLLKSLVEKGIVSY